MYMVIYVDNDGIVGDTLCDSFEQAVLVEDSLIDWGFTTYINPIKE